MSYYIDINKEMKGPYTTGQLRSMWNSGAITGQTLHCREGDTQWSPLSAIVHELEPQNPPVIPIQYSQPTPIPPTVIYQQAPEKRKGTGCCAGCVLIFSIFVIVGYIVSI